MEMVKKPRLFQQNGGENPQLATINGWIWKTSRWSDQVWYETLHSTFMKWPCPSKLPGCVYWHCLCQLCQLCQSFLCLSQNGFRAMVTCSFWLPVLWVFTIHHILFPPLSILLLVKGFTSTTVLPILNQSLIEGWENPSENSHVNMIAGYPTYVLVCVYIYYYITMEFILDI